MSDLTSEATRTKPPAQTGKRLAETLSAAVAIAVGMGFGRFAFTGMYPLMVGDGAMSLVQGSWAASANYAGYLIGALMLTRLPASRAADATRVAMLGTAICLALLALQLGPWWIVGVRLVAGMLSALAMISASVWLLQVIEHPHGAPMLFSGVGLGIFASAELIATGAAIQFHSGTIWLVLAFAAALFSAAAWPALGKAPMPATPPEQVDQVQEHVLMNAWLLVLVYGLAGFGYIITATYLPVLIKGAAPQINPLQIWAAFGVGAMPSCFFWHRLHMRAGTKRALFFNLATQAVGVALPVLLPNLTGFLASALLVGGTFVGTVTIAMPAGRRLAHRIRFNILASMTAAYGVGQIAGPLVAGALLAHTHSFSLSLMSAAVALLAAALAALL